MTLKLHELTTAPRRRARRLGRGIAAGGGKTAGRGTKGQKSRTGYKLHGRFEGGQIPFIERLPKRKGICRRYDKPVTVRIDRVLARVKGNRLTPKVLIEAGFISPKEATGLIKIVGKAKSLPALTWTRQIKFSKALADALKKVTSK